MILIPAILEQLSTRQDKTIKLVFGTSEYTPEKAGQLMGMVNAHCYLAVKVEPFRQSEVNEIEKLKAEFDNAKSQSQRIRNSLHVLFMQDNEGFETFDQYYRNKTEKYIEHLKSKME